MTDRLITHLRALWPKWNPSDEQADDVCRALSVGWINDEHSMREALVLHRDEKATVPNPEFVMTHYLRMRDVKRAAHDTRKTQGAATKTQARGANTQGTSYGNRIVSCREKYPEGFFNSMVQGVASGEIKVNGPKERPDE